jgi:hypothetical protein
MRVEPITSKAAMGLVMRHHYSQRLVGAKFAFGLVEDGEIVGCVVYSQPASYTLCNGVCGPEYRSQVLELSRLVVTTKSENAASMLIGRSVASLPDAVLVSYADCNDHVGHVGYVYQATNWLYTGQGSAEPKWLHPTTGHVISYTRRHIDLKAAALGLDWRDLVREKQSGKHRYVSFSGGKRFKKQARLALRYEVLPYPKGPTKRHDREQAETLFDIKADAR